MTAAMVLCAGLGTRLRPITDELPKPLVPVGDRPLLAHVIEVLRRLALGPVVVNAHHRADDLAREIKLLDEDVEVVREAMILGTAGGISNARTALGPGDVLVWNGDIFAPFLEVTALVERRVSLGAEILWAVAPRQAGTGTVGLDGEGYVVRLRGERFGTEAAGGDFIGVQVLGEELRGRLPAEGCLVGDVALPLLRRGGRIATLRVAEAWDDVGDPSSLLEANLRWLEQRELDGWSAQDARIAPGVELAKSLVGAGATVSGAGTLEACVVFPGATLEAPASQTLAARRAQIRI